MTQEAIIPQGQDSAERVTIIVPSFDQAAFEIIALYSYKFKWQLLSCFLWVTP